MSDETKPPRRPPPNPLAAKVQPRSETGQWKAADDRRQLTERQAAFARAYAENGGNATAAAVVAGYSPESARTAGPRMLLLPWVQRALNFERRRLLARATFGGLLVVIGILDDEREDKKLRLKAAEIALKADRAERDGEKNADGSNKRLAEMSVDELEGFIRKWEAAKAASAAPILEHEPAPAADNEPHPLDNPPQVIDPAGESTAS